MEDNSYAAVLIAQGNLGLRMLFLMLATISGSFLIARDSRSWSMSRPQRIGLIVCVALFGILGSGVPAFFAGGYIQEVALHSPVGPKTILGGILFGFIGATVYKRILGIRCETSDAFARGTALMMAFGRLGCVAQHCCFGRPYESFFSVDLGDGIARFPSQAVEALCLFVIFLVVNALHRRGLLQNRRLFFLFASYGTIRFVMESTREPVADLMFGEFTLYHAIALIAAVLGFYQMARRGRSSRGVCTP